VRTQGPLVCLDTQLVEIHRQSGEPQADKIEPIRNSLNEQIPGHAIPLGGFWTSTVDAAGNSAWISKPGNDNHYLLFPKPSRVYAIDSFSDVEKLVEQYALQREDIALEVIDWPAVAANYDAVHLTNSGLEDCWRVGHEDEDNVHAASFETWDCESTLWFRWCFERFERVSG